MVRDNGVGLGRGGRRSGLTNRQIGERMFLAEKTVKNYVSALFAKLGMERRTQAAAYAARIFGDEGHGEHTRGSEHTRGN